MSQLTNFIPKTAGECRALIENLEANRDGIAIADRYGRIDALNASEVKALIGLIKSQIGEKTAKEPRKSTNVPATRSTRKTTKK